MVQSLPIGYSMTKIVVQLNQLIFFYYNSYAPTLTSGDAQD